MQLLELIPQLDLNITPIEAWHVPGPAAKRWANLAGINRPTPAFEPDLDGLLLAEVLSTQPEPESWLAQLLPPLRLNSRLVIIDWQADGPLELGPPLEGRFKRGRLSRLLRESGFGTVETLVNHPVYYVMRAVKSPPPNHPQAGTFVEVASLAELPKNAMKRIDLFGQAVIVANTGKEIVAFAQQCPHAEGRLDEGRLRGRNVICPVHYYIWNVTSGEPVAPEDEDILPRYPVRVDPDSGKIFVGPG
ncbi:MAG: Rieske (2Fe-2S) protein [Anaerolineae bacterium]|nr:Rieske (2Fe-2S) protein [Anaerolineae bacterium]